MIQCLSKCPRPVVRVVIRMHHLASHERPQTNLGAARVGPFTDRGFENIPALEHLQPWLTALMAAA